MRTSKIYITTQHSVLLIIYSVLISSCSLQKTKPASQQIPEIAYEIRKERLERITQWKMQARIAIKTVNDASSGSLNWVQNKKTLELNLKGPFGVNVAKIKGSQIQGATANYTLQDRRGDLWQADNIDQLIYNRTGWALPIKQLRYWVLADIQNKNDALFVINDDGTLASLTYGQWRIEYQKYMLVNDIKLPSKLRITHPDINIKLSIRKWQFNHD